MIYLDHAASTPVKQEVLDVFVEAVSEYGNPSSDHLMGLKADNIIKKSQSIIANKLNCKPTEIYYTSGATMSNNIAIQGFVCQGGLHVCLSSNVEHND